MTNSLSFVYTIRFKNLYWKALSFATRETWKGKEYIFGPFIQRAWIFILPFGLSSRRSWFTGRKFLVHIFWRHVKNIHYLSFYWQKITTFVQRWWCSKHVSFHNGVPSTRYSINYTHQNKYWLEDNWTFRTFSRTFSGTCGCPICYRLQDHQLKKDDGTLAQMTLKRQLC